MTHPLVALELGSTKVACAIGMPHEHTSGFELLGKSLVSYPLMSEGWLGDPLLVSRAIEQALEATAVSGEFDRCLVAINPPSLQSEHVRAALTLGDEPVAIRAKDLARLQQRALDHALGIDREALLIERLACTGNGFDGVRDPRGLAATRLQGVFQIVTMPIAARRLTVQAVESAGLEIARLTYTLSAALAGIQEERHPSQRVLLIDVGGLATDVGLFIDGILAVSTVVPYGGLRVAMALAKDLRVTLDQATTWSLEGVTCHKVEVKAAMQRQWDMLQQAIAQLVSQQPRPDQVFVTGRGALIDGFAEWIEQRTGIPTSVGRSARLSQIGDLAQQVGLTPVMGLLVMVTQPLDGLAPRSTRLVNRLIDRTRTILTEYF